MVTFFAVGDSCGPEEAAVVLVELNLVEQRFRAVLEVLNDGATVTDVARRHRRHPVRRAHELAAPVVLPPHRNPASGGRQRPRPPRSSGSQTPTATSS